MMKSSDEERYMIAFYKLVDDVKESGYCFIDQECPDETSCDTCMLYHYLQYADRYIRKGKENETNQYN